MLSTNIFILALLLISIANNFWMYHTYNSKISSNTLSKNIKYKNFIIFYKSNNSIDVNDQIELYVNKLKKNNKIIIVSENNNPINFNTIDFNKINSMKSIN